MSAKNVIDVVIDGQIYTIGGFESEAYIQKVATYISNKISDFKKDEAYRRQKFDVQKIILELNIADDYFKAKKQAEMLEVDLESKEKEAYGFKHDLVAANVKIQTLEEQVEELNKKLVEYEKEIVKLQTELNNK